MEKLPNEGSWSWKDRGGAARELGEDSSISGAQMVERETNREMRLQDVMH